MSVTEKPELDRCRTLSGPISAAVVRILLVFIAVVCLGYALDLTTYLGITIFREQFFGLIYGLIFAAAFILFPATKKTSRIKLPWYDILFAIVGLVVGGYLFIFWPDIVLAAGLLTPEKTILGGLAVIVILEVTRRIFGWPLVILTSVFILYAHYSYMIPGAMGGRGFSWRRIAAFLYTDTGSLLGFVAVVVFGMVFSFVLFGRMLYATGGANFFTNLSLALMGGRRGGPAKVSVIASSLFGTLSGSASSNVVITGSITIPMMKNMGYRPALAAAVESVSSSGGCIMPPIMGATAFVMAEFLSIPYQDVVAAALLPAILYYISLFLQVDMEAAKVGHKGLPKSELPKMGNVIFSGWVFILPLTVLIICLFVLFFSPSKSALLATGALILVNLLSNNRINGTRFVSCLADTGQLVVEIGVIGAVAGLIVGVVALTGLGLLFSQILVSISGGNVHLLLVLTAVSSIVLGMGMPITASYIVLAVLAAPALVTAGVTPIAAHLFIFYFAMLSFITPPVCVAVYIASAIAKSRPMETAFQSVKLGFVAYLVPFIFVGNQAMLLKGGLMEISTVLVSCLAGFACLAIAFQGFFRGPVKLIGRCLLVIASVLLLVNPWGYKLGGVAVALATLIWQWRAVGMELNTRSATKGEIT